MVSFIRKYKSFAEGRYGFVMDVSLFILITILFHFFWKTYLGFFFETGFYKAVALWLANQVYHISFWINTTLLGMTIEPEHATNTMWFSQNNGYITVNRSCSGFKQFYQIFFLFALFPGPWKHKLWFIPSSMLLIFLVNIFRIVMLSIVIIHLPSQWDFVHTWVLRPFFYVIIFLEWVIWVEYFKNKKPNEVV